jgi:RNA methyltransferase, TrmH family
MSTLAFNNPNVQRLRRLLGRRSFRVAEGCLVVEGAKVLAEALDAGAVVESVFVAGGVDLEVVNRAIAGGARFFSIDQATMGRVADTVSPQPVLAVVRRTPALLETLRDPLMAGGFVVVVSGLADPGNAGTIVRSAEGAGAGGVVFCDQSVDPTSPKAVRSSAGAFFHIPIVEIDSIETVFTAFRNWGVRTWATSSVAQGGVAPDSVDLRGPCAIVLGNEANGLSVETLRDVDGLLTIPTAGRTESLNVAMSATVIVFEAARQRRSNDS